LGRTPNTASATPFTRFLQDLSLSHGKNGNILNAQVMQLMGNIKTMQRMACAHDTNNQRFFHRGDQHLAKSLKA